MAAVTRASAVPAGAVAIRPKARARPASAYAWRGAPQPSTVTATTGSPVSSTMVSVMARWRGCSGCRYAAVSHPLTTQVASMAACLPEQFCAMADLARPARIQASCSSSSIG